MKDLISFGCKNCGSPHLRESEGKLRCVSCGSVFERDVETSEERDARILYLERLDKAEGFLRVSPPRFDDAEDFYRDFIKWYPNHSDGYWGLVRARYGIKYETDINGKSIPSCYKSTYEDFRRDSDFLSALQYAESEEISEKYLTEAGIIAGVCKAWREESQKNSYDVFISFKATDPETGEESADAREMKNLYLYLIEEGYKVFFSPVSMKRYTGKHYDAYIFNALQSAKVMIVYGSKPEYFTSTWVANEWTRYLSLMHRGEKKNGSCIVAYDGFNPSELPRNLRSIQGIDASNENRSFYRDITNCINAILSDADTDSVEQTASAENHEESKPEAIGRSNKRLEVSRLCTIDNGCLKRYYGRETVVLLDERITTIGSGAFQNCQSVKRVILPERLKSIESYAFEGCKSLEIVDVPAGVTKIGYRAFCGCEMLQSITIPEGVSTIEGYSFSECSSLTSVTIPASVVKIETSAFRNCFELKKIIISNGVTEVGSSAFQGCKALEGVVVPESVSTIGYSAFEGCERLARVALSSGISAIGMDAFSGCVSLESIDLPENLSTIESRLFKGCARLSKITIPNGVEKIGGYAFQDCTSLCNVEIPDSVNHIGYSAFAKCIRLMRIRIPKSVTKVESYAFDDCSKNIRIEVDAKSIRRWDSDWNNRNLPVYDITTNKKLEKNFFGVYR